MSLLAGSLRVDAAQGKTLEAMQAEVAARKALETGGIDVEYDDVSEGV